MIERAKEVAISQSMANSYSSESGYNDLASSVSSPASVSGAAGSSGAGGVNSNNDGMDGLLDQGSGGAGGAGGGRNTLRKEQGDTESLKGRKPRFSKRHSKSGLAAVF